MRRLSLAQQDGLQECLQRGEIFPYAVMDGLKSLTRARTAESLVNLALMRRHGSGAMRCFTLTAEGKEVARAMKRPTPDPHPPLPDYDFRNP